MAATEIVCPYCTQLTHVNIPDTHVFVEASEWMTEGNLERPCQECGEPIYLNTEANQSA